MAGKVVPIGVVLVGPRGLVEGGAVEIALFVKPVKVVVGSQAGPEGEVGSLDEVIVGGEEEALEDEAVPGKEGIADVPDQVVGGALDKAEPEFPRQPPAVFVEEAEGKIGLGTVFKELGGEGDAEPVQIEAKTLRIRSGEGSKQETEEKNKQGEGLCGKARA
jgi:hypothetical protein